MNSVKQPPESVSASQLSALLVAFSTGSAIVYIPGPIAKAAGNAAWISLLAACAFGMLVLACVLYLHRAHNGQSLIGYSRTLFGNFPAVCIALPVVVMLLFSLPAIVAGIGEFQISLMMRTTPAFLFNALSLLTAALTVRAGIRVIARMFVLLVFVLLLFSIAVMLLGLSIYHPRYLLPVLPDGIMPALHGAFIAGGFPFGEVSLFSMLVPCLQQEPEGKPYRKLFRSFALTGAILTLSTVCSLMVFGPATGFLNFSLYRVATEIRLANVFERMDAIIGIALILGSHMKATLFLFILNRLLCELLRLRNDKALIFPLSLLTLFLSVTMFRDPADFERQVYVIWPFIVLSTGCGLIFLLSAATWLNRRFRAPHAEDGKGERVP